MRLTTARWPIKNSPKNGFTDPAQEKAMHNENEAFNTEGN